MRAFAVKPKPVAAGSTVAPRVDTRADAPAASCPQLSHDFGQLLVQPKLVVNTPGDAHEREADLVADRVMRLEDGEGTVGQRLALTSVATVQRACASCARDDEEQEIHRKETGQAVGGARHAPESVSQLLSSGGGHSLDGSTRQFMESRIGLDFSSVRIHSGTRAAESAAAIQARAYATGDQIVFGRGEYQPSTEGGRRLLAHELAHVGQQRRGPARVQREGMGDVRIAEGYNDLMMAIRTSDKFRALSAVDLSTFDEIIVATERSPDWPTRLSFARTLDTLFGRSTAQTDVDDAKTTLLTLGVDSAKLTALLATLSKPLFGYVASGFDFSNRFFKQDAKLGFKVENPSLDSYESDPYDRGQPATITDPAEESFKKSDILFFSGHQYAQYREPGNFTDDASDSCFNISMISKENKRVKLVVSTSCATLCKDVASIWKSKFPDALILGYRFSAPTNGGVVADAFSQQLIKLGPISLSDAGSLQNVRKAWKAVVLGGGSAGGGPALLFNGEIEFFENGKWVKKPWNDKSNECHYH